MKKINKKISKLIDTMNQMNLRDIYRVFHPATTQYTFFLAADGSLSKIDHILENKVSLSKYKKVEITPCILSDRRNETRT
jgi:exonuclease III